MNIFKVLASGRRKFSEESASVFLAWLLHPGMEHGLGATFLRRFLEGIITKAEDKDTKRSLERLLNDMEPALRASDEQSNVLYEAHLEMSVDSEFIDLVIRINDWWISIENKIYETSVNSCKPQVSLQYKGLRDKLGKEHRIISVFLVPSESCSHVQEELDAVDGTLQCDDFGVCAIWDSAGDTGTEAGGPVSIHDLIVGILHDEATGAVEPLSDYLRHTLKALVSFIRGGFQGYRYARPVSSGGMNPKATARLTYEDLKSKSLGSVGVSGGLAGLLQYGENDLKRRKFQYSEEEMSERNWMSVNKFNTLAGWLTGGVAPDIHWEGTFSSDALLKIATVYDSIFIGISGGERGLYSLSVEEIARKRWGISETSKTSQWIPAKKYVQILAEKGIEQPGQLSRKGTESCN